MTVNGPDQNIWFLVVCGSTVNNVFFISNCSMSGSALHENICRSLYLEMIVHWNNFKIMARQERNWNSGAYCKSTGGNGARNGA